MEDLNKQENEVVLLTYSPAFIYKVLRFGHGELKCYLISLCIFCYFFETDEKI